MFTHWSSLLLLFTSTIWTLIHLKLCCFGFYFFKKGKTFLKELQSYPRGRDNTASTNQLVLYLAFSAANWQDWFPLNFDLRQGIVHLYKCNLECAFTEFQLLQQYTSVYTNSEIRWSQKLIGLAEQKPKVSLIPLTLCYRLSSLNIYIFQTLVMWISWRKCISCQSNPI